MVHFEKKLGEILSSWIGDYRERIRLFTIYLSHTPLEEVDKRHLTEFTDSVRQYKWSVAREVLAAYGDSSREYEDAASSLLTTEERERMDSNIKEGQNPLHGIALVDRGQPSLDKLLSWYQNAERLSEELLHLSGKRPDLRKMYQQKVKRDYLFKPLSYREHRTNNSEESQPQPEVTPPAH